MTTSFLVLIIHRYSVWSATTLYHISEFHYIKWSSGIAGQTRYNRGLYFLKMDHSVISIQFVCKTYVTYLYACQNMLPKSFQTCPSSATAIPNSLTMYHFNSACFENRHDCLFGQLSYNVHKWEHITYMYQTNCHTLHTAAPEHFKTNNCCPSFHHISCCIFLIHVNGLQDCTFVFVSKLFMCTAMQFLACINPG